ncbi:unnamed protein product [Spirodela intermedia]|uniref:S-acyltransferase n=1 Tax=Spirodela intermedia TaxID=51605 RepID=A0A7I8KQV1_SPIIN|nr:unnamed protein product [Spirodela intermedia]
MEMQWVLVLHALATLLVVVSLLCGHWPIFEGTFIERIHFFITVGAYDYLTRFVITAFGSRGRHLLFSVEHYCCERPNPILQIFYLSIVGVTYYFIAKSSFRYIPGYYVDGSHRYLSMVGVSVGGLLFLLTSFSDPGTVNAENVSQYASAYPYDNIIYVKKFCSTCKIPKPARSKHCKICNRCVARFDHHCGWMNNCIGEKNTRYFMAFLLWHFLLCLYGAVVLGLILACQMKQHKIVYILTTYYGIDSSFYSLAPHISQWLLASYNTQVLIIAFLTVVSLLLAGFFGYHAHLCLTNTTTNETFKWQDYVSWKTKLNEAKASAAALKASLAGGVVTAPPGGERVEKMNAYDRGVLGNLGEVVRPLSERAPFSRGKKRA